MVIFIALLSVCALYLLHNYLFNRLWMKNLSAELNFSQENAMEGQDISLHETVTNRKWLPLPIIQVKFMTSKYLIFADNHNSNITDHYYRNDILSLMMFQRITRTLTFNCSHRGYYIINRMDLVCSNIFMTLANFKDFELDIHLYVYPKTFEYVRIEIPFQKMLGTVLTKRFINEDPFEFRTIREYQSYDNLKAINWKASAKTGTLKVNVNDYTSSQQIKIFLNIEYEGMRIHEDIQEESIRIAATFAIAFIEQGIPVSILTNAKDIITHEVLHIPPGSGKNHIRALMETLSRIDTAQGATAFVSTIQQELEQSTKNDYIILISAYQKDDLQCLLMDQQQFKIEYSWIIPTNNEVEIHVCDAIMSKVVPWNMIS